ncbi:MAG: hypothetical protein AXA67_04080 [Methylothermaceae bacteria B42]|nr:MAG: hypothetical protein AXA67_04080 [Methylothermaceae bacteria B42]HHJ38622.1 M23 family metallopeptidase [Methylothermaceae bacterium]
MKPYYLLALSLFFFTAKLHAQPLPVHSPVPGGVAILNLGDGSLEKPVVTFNDRPVLVLKNEGQWTALVGIPLKTKPGQYKVNVRRSGEKRTLELTVSAKEYPAQYIKLPKGKERYVSPPPEDLARIKRERKILGKILSQWRPTDQVDTDFHLPVHGRIGSPFGLRRFFNDQPRNPHSGLDLVAPAGTPIKAPADGIVIDRGDFFFTGNAVFLDHGQGLISGYFHMQDIAVKPGQKVKRGDILGTVGATGRVTGPHLHMNVYLNRTKVDPELFLRRYLQAKK